MLNLDALSHRFTKLAVSPLIMVRFSKFKLWHTQDSDPDLINVTETSRHACDVIHTRHMGGCHMTVLSRAIY